MWNLLHVPPSYTYNFYVILNFLENFYTPLILQVGQYPSCYDYSSETIIATNTGSAEKLYQSIAMKYFPYRNALIANHERKV
jgi:hypothetical protein